MKKIKAQISAPSMPMTEVKSEPVKMPGANQPSEGSMQPHRTMVMQTPHVTVTVHHHDHNQHPDLVGEQDEPMDIANKKIKSMKDIKDIKQAVYMNKAKA